MDTYPYSFLRVLRVVALIGLAISCIVTCAVLLDIFAKVDFGYPWWALLIALEAVSKRRRYDPVGAGQPGQIVIRRVCEDLTRERCGPRPPAGIIAGLGYAMEAT
jgi:hypothetical protein